MRLHIQTEIHATADAVWSVLTAFDEYEKWNPFVVRAAAKTKNTLDLWVETDPEDRYLGLEVKLTTHNTPVCLRAQLNYGPAGLLDGRYAANIVADGARAILHQDVVFSGLLRRFYVKAPFGRKVLRGLNSMAAALKQQCESG